MVYVIKNPDIRSFVSQFDYPKAGCNKDNLALY